MNKDDLEQMKMTVKLGVSEGVEPIWEKMRNHDTEIALLKQDSTQGAISAHEQGKRLGKVEIQQSKDTAHKKWFIGIFTFIKAAVLAILGWLISTKY